MHNLNANFVGPVIIIAIARKTTVCFKPNCNTFFVSYWFYFCIFYCRKRINCNRKPRHTKGHKAFWLGIMMIIVFSVKLGWLPSFGIDQITGWIMPTLALSVMSIAQIARTTRSSMLEYLNSDFVRTARAKGQKESVVIFKHMFKNALIPIITVAGGTFGALLGGAVMMEQVFAIPGLGKYMVDAIKANNYPAVRGGVLYLAVVQSIVNLLIDLIYAFIDPRIKASFKGSAGAKKLRRKAAAETAGQEGV